MIHEQLFVGLLAVALGSVGVAAAALNWERSYHLRKARWLEAKWGRAAVRVAYAVIGVLLILLGVAIVLGFGPNASSERASLVVRGSPDPAPI